MIIILILQEVYGILKEIINNADVTNDDNAPSFKYKANIICNPGEAGKRNNIKIVVPLKYLSNF